MTVQSMTVQEVVVKRSSQVLAFLAYALLIIGSLVVLLGARKDRFAVYHARQSLALSLAIIIGPLIWLVVGWLIAWIPSVGVVVSAASFSLVIGLYLMAVVAWITGMVNAATAQMKPLPFFGDWAQQLFT
jgi:uncharacterized membrane protein